MSGFAADWLALREPYDRVARSAMLADRFVAALGPAPRLIDLGCGTGANFRYLAPRMPQGRWLCVDKDRELLARAEELGREHHARFEEHDIAKGLGELALDDGGVTASALLDLTSAAWLDQLARCSRRAVLLIALSFDGRLIWEPALAEDAMVRERFLAHQRTDKGFGPALGPDAAMHLTTLLERRGRHVTTAASDWRLGPDDRALVEAMLEGVVTAAAAIEDDRALSHWAEVRRAQLGQNALGLIVGHVDLLALPEAA